MRDRRMQAGTVKSIQLSEVALRFTGSPRMACEIRLCPAIPMREALWLVLRSEGSLRLLRRVASALAPPRRGKLDTCRAKGANAFPAGPKKRRLHHPRRIRLWRKAAALQSVFTTLEEAYPTTPFRFDPEWQEQLPLPTWQLVLLRSASYPRLVLLLALRWPVLSQQPALLVLRRPVPHCRSAQLADRALRCCR
jgi:hypothetical protein